ncbi:MAG: 3'-5' exonuclease [Firmicutes bacterium]|nr:3'-5' exonuclease [Bacillota bacterium]
MGLFGSKNESEKYPEIDKRYDLIMNGNLKRDERISVIEAYEMFCDSFSDSEIKGFNKYVLKNTKNKLTHSYTDHPLYGLVFFGDNTFENNRNRIKRLKATLLEAKHSEEIIVGIDEVAPVINKGATLNRNRVSDIPEIKIQNITKSFNVEAKLPSFVVIDMETTGLSPGKDKIIQVSAIRYDDLQPEEAFVTNVDPDRHIPEDASQINGLFDEDVKGAPLFSEIAESLIAFVGNSPIVGYNVAFDLKFLYCSGIDLITNKKIYDVMALAKKVFKNDLYNYELKTVAEACGIVIDNYHHAKADCYATGQAFIDLIDRITDN